MNPVLLPVLSLSLRALLASAEPPAPSPTGPAPVGLVRIEWDAPDSCPASDDVRREASQFLGQPADPGQKKSASATSETQIQVRARVEEHGTGRWLLTLEIETLSGAIVRRVEAESCAMLASAAALVLAVVLDPASVLEQVTEPTREPTPPTPPAVTPQPESRPAAPRREPALGGHARVAFETGFGFLPSVDLGARASLGLRADRWRVELSGTYLPPRDVYAPDTTAGARLQLWTLGARGCYAPHVSRFEFPLCIGGELGSMRGDGLGISTPETSRARVSAAVLGVAVVLVVHRLAGLYAGVDGWIALDRPSFEIEDLGVVHEVTAGGVRGSLGIELRFP